MAMAREHVDPLDAAFDDIFLAEEKFTNQGYQEGFELGKKAGVEEGRVMGIGQGRSVGSEVGFYHGFACSWKVILESDSSKGPRALKAVDALLELIWRIPIRNNEYPTLTEDMDRIRAKFRQVCSLLGVSPDFGVVSTISKLCKTCTFRLTPGKIYFILSEQVANGGVSMWCELPQANFFDQFQMEGVSAEDNEIYLELVPDNMSRALKSAQAAKLVKIKLTKKHAACLTFDIELPSLTNQSRTVVHDVPVNVIARRLWGEYQEPAMPQFDVSVYLPALKTIKTVVEKMKNLSNFLVLSANRNGDMTLKVETDLAEVTTLFRELEIPSWSREEESGVSQSDRDTEEMAEARVDIRKFSQFLAGQQVNPDRIICNIVDGNILHFFVLHEDLSLQYFIPTVAI